MKFDHIARTSKNIADSIAWYVDNLKAEVIYKDDTWGLVRVGNVKIAFVMAHQHPSHICFEVDEEYIEKNLSHKIFKTHRDDSASCYVKDADGNHIEFLKWPKKSG